ncbi:MAG: type II secretion system protein [Myxococcales bacterium]|nr:type II secretion system protein [Myxococcales bacterium]
MRRDAKQQGFTLLEVMIGLSLLGFALTVLIKSAAGNIFNARQAQMMGVVTDLARAKMYDIEEELIKDGFSDTGLSDANDACTDFKPFDDEGWPNVEWCAKIEQVELPNWDTLQAMAGAGSGSAAGSGDGSAAGGGFQDSALGGMLSMIGGGFGGGGASSMDMDSKAGASFIQGQYGMVQEILKVSIRKVTLFIKWQVAGSDRDMKVVAFFTDSAAMDKVLSGMGAQELPENTGSGSGSGSGRGSGSGSGRTR